MQFIPAAANKGATNEDIKHIQDAKRGYRQ